jgi:hypothetical protein
VYTDHYNKYISAHPTDYRARISLAEIYIYERLFDIDHLNEAHTELDAAIALVPQAPQAYWMKARYLFVSAEI